MRLLNRSGRYSMLYLLDTNIFIAAIKLSMIKSIRGFSDQMKR